MSKIQDGSKHQAKVGTQIIYVHIDSQLLQGCGCLFGAEIPDTTKLQASLNEEPQL
jgi:hypothetical protein